MQNIRTFIITLTSAALLLLTTVSLAQAPFPELTIKNATTQNPLQVHCGVLNSFYIPPTAPVHIHWTLFWFLFFSASGSCNVITKNQIDATIDITISPNGSQGKITAIHKNNPNINISFVKGRLGVMTPNVGISISGI